MPPLDLKTDIQLIPVSQFTDEQLAAIYNQTRVDYLMPMQMDAARLGEYIKTYDVSRQHSAVAWSSGGEMLGVNMLGLRTGRAWLTRLGVIPNTRRHGVGRLLMESLMQRAADLSISFFMLEVIKNNIPAHQLFLNLGFYEVGELLILRRPPLTQAVDPITADALWIDHSEALELAGLGRGMQPWTNQSESLSNTSELSGLRLTLADGSRGWLVYQCRDSLLTRFVFKTEAGDPAAVAYALLSHVHSQYPYLDTQVENIRFNDPHLPAFYRMGYVEAFRRIEMWRGTPPPDIQK